jgi:hypothetical protein
LDREITKAGKQTIEDTRISKNTWKKQAEPKIKMAKDVHRCLEEIVVMKGIWKLKMVWRNNLCLRGYRVPPRFMRFLSQTPVHGHHKRFLCRVRRNRNLNTNISIHRTDELFTDFVLLLTFAAGLLNKDIGFLLELCDAM